MIRPLECGRILSVLEIFPSPRSSASAAIIEDKFWLYGGSDPAIIHEDMYELNMLSLSWTRVDTIQKPTKGCYSTLTPITGSHLVLHGGSGDVMSPWIFDVDSCTWRQLPSDFIDRHGRCKHSAITGLRRNVIIIGGWIDKLHEDYDVYTPFFCVMFEPKSLQQIAMKTIYEQRTELPWKILPQKLICQIMGPETTILWSFGFENQVSADAMLNLSQCEKKTQINMWKL